jgi:hypothetical protein
MILPSNDWFIGNNDALEISGLITGGVGSSLTFEFGRVYHAGTELEDFQFLPGNPIVGSDPIATPGGGTTADNPISLASGIDPLALSPTFHPTLLIPQPSTSTLAGLETTPSGASPSPSCRSPP